MSAACGFLPRDGSRSMRCLRARRWLAGVDAVQAMAGSLNSNVVLSAWHSGVNQPPVVSAGAEQSVTLPCPAVLNEVVSDDGLPGLR